MRIRSCPDGRLVLERSAFPSVLLLTMYFMLLGAAERCEH